MSFEANDILDEYDRTRGELKVNPNLGVKNKNFDTYSEEDKRQVLLNKIEILFDEFMPSNMQHDTLVILTNPVAIKQLRDDIKALI